MRAVRAITAVVTSVVTSLLVVAPAAAAEPGASKVRFTAAGGSATWGWHKVAAHPDGSATYRTGYLRVGIADIHDGPRSTPEDDIYAHTEDYTYRADGSFVGKVNRLFLGSRDTLTFDVSADYTSARLTGTMTETDCDTHFEVCTDLGPVAVEADFTAVEALTVYDNDTHHPTRWAGQMTHIYSGGSAYASATATFGVVTMRPTFAAFYSEFDSLTTNNCRNACEYW